MSSSVPVNNESALNAAAETVELCHSLSTLLNCGFDRQTMGILIALCECGVNPEALAQVVKQLKRQAQTTQNTTLQQH